MILTLVKSKLFNVFQEFLKKLMLICSEASMYKKLALHFYYYVPLIFLGSFIQMVAFNAKAFDLS